MERPNYYKCINHDHPLQKPQTTKQNLDLNNQCHPISQTFTSAKHTQ